MRPQPLRPPEAKINRRPAILRRTGPHECARATSQRVEFAAIQVRVLLCRVQKLQMSSGVCRLTACNATRVDDAEASNYVSSVHSLVSRGISEGLAVAKHVQLEFRGRPLTLQLDPAPADRGMHCRGGRLWHRCQSTLTCTAEQCAKPSGVHFDSNGFHITTVVFSKLK